MSIPTEQTRWILAERPVTQSTASTFKKETVPVPEPSSEDEVLIRNDVTSLDPAMRGWIRDIRSYLPPVQIGEVMVRTHCFGLYQTWELINP